MTEDGHRGIETTLGIFYTYEHTKRGFKFDNDDLAYKVTCIIDYPRPTSVHLNTYYVPSELLDNFLRGFHEVAEEILDIRPVKKDEVPKLLEEFKERE